MGRDGFARALSRKRDRDIRRDEAGLTMPGGDQMSRHVHTPAKHFACGVVVPDCTFRATAPTEEALMKQVAAHAAEAHGVTEITPDLSARVKAAIKTR